MKTNLALELRGKIKYIGPKESIERLWPFLMKVLSRLSKGVVC